MSIEQVEPSGQAHGRPEREFPPQFHLLAVVRYGLALLLTVFLAYMAGLTMVGIKLMGGPSSPYNLGVFLLSLLGVLILTNGQGMLEPLKPRRSDLHLLSALIWIIGHSLLGILYFSDRTNKWLFIPIYVVATMPIYWIAWSYFQTMTEFRRWGILLASILPAAGFFYFVDIPEMEGNTKVLMTWRRFSRPTLPGVIQSDKHVAESLGNTSINDFPGFLGSHRDATIARTKLSKDWSTPPKALWRQPIGSGDGGFAVVGEYAFTQEQRADDEVVACYELRTGKQIWAYSYTAYTSGMGGIGPRATPTVVDAKVYALGGQGKLLCLDAAGKLVWQADILKDHQGANLSHGMAGSPFVAGGKVFVCPKGQRDGKNVCLAAYDQSTGKLLWSTGNDDPSYGSPVQIDVNGVSQVLAFVAKGIISVDPNNGAILWKHDWANIQSTHASQPVVILGNPDRVLAATAYDKGSTLFEVNKGKEREWSTKTIWTSRDMQTKFTTPVIYRDYIYGLDNGILACCDLKTGKRRWKKGRYGHGQLLLVGPYLLILTEQGEGVLADADPNKLTEHGRFEAIRGKTWNVPALVGNLFLVRNAEEAACYELPEQANILPPLIRPGTDQPIDRPGEQSSE